jgi:hypothetical protein
MSGVLTKIHKRLDAVEKLHEEAVLTTYKASAGFNQAMANITALYREVRALQRVVLKLGATEEDMRNAFREVDEELTQQLEELKTTGQGEEIEAQHQLAADAKARWQLEQDRRQKAVQASGR